MKLPYDPATPLLGIYPKKTESLIQKNICTLCLLKRCLQQPRSENKQPRFEPRLLIVVAVFIISQPTKNIQVILINCLAWRDIFMMDNTFPIERCPPVHMWIKMLCYIYTMEYYLGITKTGILLFATAWMDLEIIMLI